MKELKISDLEKEAAKLFLYPRKLGNGLYEISQGIIVNERMMEKIDRYLFNNAEKDLCDFLADNPVIYDSNGTKITALPENAELIESKDISFKELVKKFK